MRTFSKVQTPPIAPSRASRLAALALVGLLCLARRAPAQLPSWSDGAVRTRLIEFVRAVTDSPSATFVPRAERVAVFDNDGTLWSEMPIYTQFTFMLDQVQRAAPAHPEWRSNAAYRTITAPGADSVAKLLTKPVLAFLDEANVGTTTDEYDRAVRDWMARAREPRFGKPYTEMVYQPMRELMQYLRDNGFKTYIVSGGGIEFMRPWVEGAYGIPPEQVMGTIPKVAFRTGANGSTLERRPGIAFDDDGAGKPVGIYQMIGRRPIAAFGNSDGDLEMLRYVADGPGPRLALVVHHTDAEREWAYDRKSPVGTLDKALDAAVARRWIIVDMKRDWKRVFAFQ